MTRALKILAVVIAAVLCQTNLSALVRLQSIAPDFMIAALVALAFHYGTYGGFCAGAVMGLLYDSAVGYVLALNIIIYTFIGYAAPAGKALLQGKVPVRRRRKWLEALILGFIMTMIRGFVTLVRMLMCSAYTAVWTIPTLILVDRFLRAPKKTATED